MITFYNDQTYKLFALSTDTKPLLGKNSNGSHLFEIDTGKTYVYDFADAKWTECPESGGGGTSDVTKAYVDNQLALKQDKGDYLVSAKPGYLGDYYIDEDYITSKDDKTGDYLVVVSNVLGDSGDTSGHMFNNTDTNAYIGGSSARPIYVTETAAGEVKQEPLALLSDVPTQGDCKITLFPVTLNQDLSIKSLDASTTYDNIKACLAAGGYPVLAVKRVENGQELYNYAFFGEEKYNTALSPVDRYLSFSSFCRHPQPNLLQIHIAATDPEQNTKTHSDLYQVLTNEQYAKLSVLANAMTLSNNNQDVDFNLNIKANSLDVD